MLRFILASHEIKIDFGVMAKLLGPNCTPRAVQEKLKKLKKIGLEEAAAAAAGTGAEAVAGTGVEAASPRKRAKPAASKEPTKGKRVKDEPKEESMERFEKEVEEGEKNDEDNESILCSPAKRPRTK